MFFRLFLILCLCCLSGCFRINYRLAEASGNTYRNEYWRHYYLFGFVPEKESDGLAAFCQGRRTVEIHTHTKPGNVLASALSGGLNGAYTVEAVCVE